MVKSDLMYLDRIRIQFWVPGLCTGTGAIPVQSVLVYVYKLLMCL